MRKTLVIIITIAILGSLGIYANDHNSTSAISRKGVSSKKAASNITPSASTSYKDGAYTGNTSETPYGPVQISVVVSGGKITGINFLQMPSDLQHSQEVTAFAEPLLKQETLSTQSANIDFVSGATSTSFGYQESLQAALDQAKLS